MPLPPKSPRAPSRVLRTPSTPTLPRTPKRLAATPRPQQQEAKRMPTTPQPTPSAMTPKRAAQATPSSIHRSKSEHASTIRSPKRTPSSDAGRGVVKKRVFGELAPKRSLPTAKPEISILTNKSVTGDNPKDKEKTLRRTKSDRSIKQVKRSKILQRRPGRDKEPALDAKGADSLASRASIISKKRQPRVKFASSVVGGNPSGEEKKKDKDLNWTDNAPQQRVTTAKCEFQPTQSKLAERDHPGQQDKDTVPKSKTKKKRPTAGRFDLRLPDNDDKEMVAVVPSKKAAGSGYHQAPLSPEIMFNETMTESKLQLLEASPLNRLIPEKDRKAAAAELAAEKIASARKEGKRIGGLNSNDLFVPLEQSGSAAANGDSAENPKLEAARKKESRKMKWKARQMRKRGELPDGDGDESSKRTGVVYLGHIPHGFYEKEIRAYFSQFGEVTRIRLSRSKKTSRSRGFAFLEFADANVAAIAAEAMDGYLMHERALVAKVVPEEKVHPDTFKGANRTFKKVPWSSIERRKMIARAKDPLKLASRSLRVKKMSKDRMKSLARKGIKYDFPGLSL